MPPNQGCLFPKVRMIAAHDRSLASAAYSGREAPVDAALAGANVTGLQAPITLSDPELQLPRVEEFEIGWFRESHFITYLLTGFRPSGCGGNLLKARRPAPLGQPH